MVSDYRRRRNLDRKVARVIMGKNMSFYDCHHKTPFCTCPSIPHYSTHLARAWEVLEKVTKPPTGELPHSTNYDFMFRFQEASIWAMSEEEAARWICESALKCVLSPTSISDAGKPEKSTKSAVEWTPCPSSKMGMSERSCFPTSTRRWLMRQAQEMDNEPAVRIRLIKPVTSMTGEVPVGTEFKPDEWATGTFPIVYINGERAMLYPSEYEVVDED